MGAWITVDTQLNLSEVKVHFAMLSFCNKYKIIRYSEYVRYEIKKLFVPGSEGTGSMQT